MCLFMIYVISLFVNDKGGKMFVLVCVISVTVICVLYLCYIWLCYVCCDIYDNVAIYDSCRGENVAIFYDSCRGEQEHLLYIYLL